MRLNIQLGRGNELIATFIQKFLARAPLSLICRVTDWSQDLIQKEKYFKDLIQKGKYFKDLIHKGNIFKDLIQKENPSEWRKTVPTNT